MEDVETISVPFVKASSVFVSTVVLLIGEVVTSELVDDKSE